MEIESDKVDFLDVGFLGMALRDKCRPTFFDAGLLQSHSFLKY